MKKNWKNERGSSSGEGIVGLLFILGFLIVFLIKAVGGHSYRI